MLTAPAKFRQLKGFTLVELLIVVTIIAVLAAIAIPNVQQAVRRTRYARAASDTKLVVTQAVTYASDKNRYPVSIQILRDTYYINVPDKDPWGVSYQLAPALLNGSIPGTDDDLYVYSRGASLAGTYNPPASPPGDPGLAGSVGYSSVYGLWMGQ